MAATNPTVLLLPGLWSPRLMLLPWRYWLQSDGHTVKLFSNRYFSHTAAANADQLAQHLHQADAVTDTLHLIGHSLGGIVLLHLLARLQTASQQCDDGVLPAAAAAALLARIKSVQLVGSPVQGSQVGKRFAGRRWRAALLGQSGKEGVYGGAPLHGVGQVPVGVIRGTRPGGPAHLLWPEKAPGDGVVALSEAVVARADATANLHASHTGLLLSRDCARLLHSFINHQAYPALASRTAT